MANRKQINYYCTYKINGKKVTEEECIKHIHKRHAELMKKSEKSA